MNVCYFLEIYSYIGVFLLTLFGNLGLPIPEEVIFITAGSLAAEGFVSFLGILFFSMFSILITNDMSFFIGKFFGRRLFKLLSRVKTFEFFIFKTEELFEKKGRKAVFLSRFIWNIRNWVPLIAGASNMKWREFQKYDFFGVLIYTPILVGLGFFYSHSINAIVGKVQTVKQLIFVIFILFVLVYIFRKTLVFFSKTPIRHLNPQIILKKLKDLKNRRK